MTLRKENPLRRFVSYALPRGNISLSIRAAMASWTGNHSHAFIQQVGAHACFGSFAVRCTSATIADLLPSHARKRTKVVLFSTIIHTAHSTVQAPEPRQFSARAPTHCELRASMLHACIVVLDQHSHGTGNFLADCQESHICHICQLERHPTSADLSATPHPPTRAPSLLPAYCFA